MKICIYADALRLQARLRDDPQDLPDASLQSQAWPLGQGAVAYLNSQLSTLNQQPTPGRKLGITATKKIPGDGFKRPWPPLVKMGKRVRERIAMQFGNAA